MGADVNASLARVPVSEEQIDQVVAAFYARVRVHPVLGPIFNDSISTDADLWRVHEAKIGRFWRNALLRQPVYDGNPMMVHAGTMAVKAHHFAIWLELFDQVLAEELPEQTARAWSKLAHRIGRGLSLGLDTARARHRPGAVPDLRG
ncbi:MAG: group III truncated hemoglobin [Paracoccaceae bacterium]